MADQKDELDQDIIRKLPRNILRDFARRLPTRREMEAVIVARAWKDSEFRERLIKDAPNVIEAEFPYMLKDGKYPNDVRIQVLEEDRNTKYLVLPRLPDHVAKQDLTHEQLASVAGATACIDASYTNSGCQVTQASYCTCAPDGCEPVNDAAADDVADAAADAAADACCCICCL